MSETKTHSRRQFMRGVGVLGAVGIAATGTATAENGSGTDADGEPCDPLEETGCSFGSEPDYGVSYLVGRVRDHFTGFGSEEDYEEAQARSLYLQARSDAELIRQGNDQVLTQVENLTENARSVAYQKGRAALLEAVNNGSTPLNAVADGTEAIEEYIVPNQKNIIERWNVIFIQVKLIIERANETDGISPSEIFSGGDLNFRDGDEDDVSSTHGQQNYTLVNGETMFADGMRWNKRLYFGNEVYAYIAIDDTTRAGPNDDSGAGTVDLRSDPEGDGSSITVINQSPFEEALNGLEQAYSNAVSDLEGFAEGINEEYRSGDIDVEDIVTPQDLWEMSSDDAENPYAAADLAGLGLEVDQASQLTVDLLDDELLIDGSVYLSESPIGENLEVGSVYDPTASVEYEDDEDEPVDYEGTEDDPIPLDGLIFIAYNTDDGSTYDQIQQPFEVVDAVGEDGEAIDEVGYEPSGGQQTTTTDIDELRDELESMNDEINRVEEERREAATGGGLFGDVGVGEDAGLIAVVVAIAVLLLSGGGS